MDLEDYMDLPYTFKIIKDGEVWFGEVEELPGCMTQADSWLELGDMIYDALHAWLEAALEEGQNIPLPREN